jgi:hypothetical protein
MQDKYKLISYKYEKLHSIPATTQPMLRNTTPMMVLLDGRPFFNMTTDRVKFFIFVGYQFC